MSSPLFRKEPKAPGDGRFDKPSSAYGPPSPPTMTEHDRRRADEVAREIERIEELHRLARRRLRRF